MSFKAERLPRQPEYLYRDVRCDGCDAELELAVPFAREDGAWESLQPKGALEVRIGGGYGMAVDPIGEVPHKFIKLFCKACTGKLCAEWPCFEAAIKPKTRVTIANERAVLFWDNHAWVVQGVDCDIAAQGSDYAEACDHFGRTVCATRLLNQSRVTPPHQIKDWWDRASESEVLSPWELRCASCQKELRVEDAVFKGAVADASTPMYHAWCPRAKG